MSRDIESIVNVTSYAVLTSSGEWTYNGGMPCPDEVVVRQLTYSGTGGLPELLIIKSNLGVLGSIITSDNFQSTPGTRIQPRSFSGPLTFGLFVPFASLQPAVVTVGDRISVSLDFIRYRK